MNRKSRSGYSLIELSAVLGVSSVLAGISVWLVHMSMQKTRDGQRHLASRKTVARLAETFRRDVHAAVSIAQDPAEKNADTQDGSVWSLRLGSGNVVRYRLETGRLVRDEFRPTPSGSIDTKTAAAHETFDLPAAKLSISLEPPSAPRKASLLITATKANVASNKQNHRPTPTKTVVQSVRIDAAMSIDHRFKQIKTVEVKPSAISENEEVEK